MVVVATPVVVVPVVVARAWVAVVALVWVEGGVLAAVRGPGSRLV